VTVGDTAPVPDLEQSARAFAAAWNSADWEAIERLTDPAVTIRAPREWPEAGEFDGWAAVRAQWERLREGLSGEAVAVLDVDPIDAHRILVHSRWTGTASSGLALEIETWTVSTWRDGRLLRHEYHLDEASARAAL